MKDSSLLLRYGYGQYVENNRTIVDATPEQLARVTAEHKGAYDVITAAGEFRAVVTGKRMLMAADRDDYPAVGDWVMILEDNTELKTIIEILPRKTTLHKQSGGNYKSQLIAANVDVAFIVGAIDRDYNLNRFERYLVLALEGGVKPVIVLNKSDLSSAESVANNITDIRKRFGKIDVLATSTLTESGADELIGYIDLGVTYCFLGSSGVGKSTLINRILHQDRIATKEIGIKTGRGKHTTTSREMYVTDDGGIIIDNPGSREVGIVDATDGISNVFANIEDMAQSCKFKDCRHTNEPGCAVKEAINNMIISESQFDNYQKLRKESEHYERTTYEKRQKDKEFGKFIKHAKKDLKNL